MSRQRWVLALSLVFVAALLTGPAHASCAGPQLAVAPARAAAGESVTVTGRYLFDGCHDTASGCSRRIATNRPQRGITLELVTEKGVIPLGAYDPDDTGARTQRVTVPAGVVGPVTVRLLTKRGDEYAATQLLVIGPLTGR